MRNIPGFLSFAAAFLLIVSLFSCEHNEYDDLSCSIIGRWQWIRTVSPWTGYISDPQTAGYTEALEFTSHGIMTEYKNNVLIHTSNYRIELHDVNFYMLVDDTGISTDFYLKGDTLQFNQAYVDGPVTVYARIR